MSIIIPAVTVTMEDSEEYAKLLCNFDYIANGPLVAHLTDQSRENVLVQVCSFTQESLWLYSTTTFLGPDLEPVQELVVEVPDFSKSSGCSVYKVNQGFLGEAAVVDAINATAYFRELEYPRSILTYGTIMRLFKRLALLAALHEHEAKA